MEQFKKLNSVEKAIADAIVQQNDIFRASQDAQIRNMQQLHNITEAKVELEHRKTRQIILDPVEKIIQGR
jgi:hypothetical protein